MKRVLLVFLFVLFLHARLLAQSGTNRVVFGGLTPTLAWDHSPDVTNENGGLKVEGYYIYYATMDGGLTNSLDAGLTNVCKILSLTEEHINFIYVTAYNSNRVESDPSNVVYYYPLTNGSATTMAVALTGPKNGEILFNVTNLAITTTVGINSAATLAKMEFFDGAVKLGETNGSDFVWSSVTGGSHALWAKATDSLGGTARSGTNTIRIHYLRTASVAPDGTTATIGEVVQFTARSDVTEPRFYQWSFNGVPIPMAVGDTLILNNLEMSQSGSYSVAVSNDTEFATSTPAVLTVELTPDPPTILVQPHDASDFVGGQVQYTVQADGYEPMDYQWRWNGAPIQGAHAASVAFSNLARTNAGNVDVVVSNAYGAITSQVARLSISTLSVWGDNRYDQSSLDSHAGSPVRVALGWSHHAALFNDGTVVMWGDNSRGQGNTPAGLGNVTALSCGAYHTLALKSDGTVVGWGANWLGQANPPPGLDQVMAISAGWFHNLALRSNGTVVAWGYGYDMQTAVPNGLSHVRAVAAGGFHSLALKEDGTVAAWGNNWFGQGVSPVDLAGVKAIAAGAYHNLAILNDGTVFGWGDNRYGQLDVPTGLTSVVMVACGNSHSLALREDGTAWSWGHNQWLQSEIPDGLQNVVYVTAGGDHSMVILSQLSP